MIANPEPFPVPGALAASAALPPPRATPTPRMLSHRDADARTPRADAPPLHTLREGAAGLTSLLLAEDDAALGVGER